MFKEKNNKKWFSHPALEVKESTIPNSGIGIFTNEDILAHTVIESSPVLIFSGRTFYSEEALLLGLISRKISSPEINDKVTEIALNLSKKSPTSMNLGRAAFLRTNDLDYRRGVANAVEDFCNAATTPDAQEGLKAFLEKRKPIWET